MRRSNHQCAAFNTAVTEGKGLMGRIKAKELLLFLVPMLMVGVGFMLRGREAPQPLPVATQPAPFSLTVKDVRFESVTPREVAQGFDTRVAVLMEPSGKLPSNSSYRWQYLRPRFEDAHLIYQRDGKPRRFQMADGSAAVQVEPQFDDPQGTVRFMLPLSQVPASDSAVTLKAKITSVDAHGTVITPPGQKVNAVTVTRIPATVFSFVVRKPGEQVQTPIVSRECPLALDQVTVTDKSSPLFAAATMGADTLVHLTVKYDTPSWLGRPPRPVWKFGKPYLVDEKGRRYSTFRWPGVGGGKSYSAGINYGGMSWSGTAGNYAADGKYSTSYWLPLASVPKSAGKLTLKSQISVNEMWPLSISVVVRDPAKTQSSKSTSHG